MIPSTSRSLGCLSSILLVTNLSPIFDREALVCATLRSSLLTSCMVLNHRHWNLFDCYETEKHHSLWHSTRLTEFMDGIPRRTVHSKNLSPNRIVQLNLNSNLDPTKLYWLLKNRV